MVGHIRARGICVRVGRTVLYTVLYTLKGGGTEKREGNTWVLKRGGKLSQGVGALQKRGVLEPPYELWIYKIYIRSASKAYSTMVGTWEKDIIRDSESKYDEYCIFLCEFFYFFPVLRKKYRTTVTHGSAKLCHICFYKRVLK